MPPAIHTEQLTKDFIVGFWRTERRRALDGLTLEIGPGEVFGFLGANGAGKTTTLKLLLQLIFPTSGVARVLGRPAGDLSVRRRIGFLPEEPSFYDALTPEELLVYFGSLFGYASADRRVRATRCLDAVGVGAERRIALRRLSKGTVQRVGIAQAIVNDPEVVFLDEPMSALDPLGRRDVRALVLQLRDRGCTVFFSSHILPDAEAVCSRVGILANGRLLTAGRLSEILAGDVRGWELVVDGVTANAPTLIHGDYWFGNTVWRDGRLNGIIDWDGARIDDPALDVAIARNDIVIFSGPPMADLFLERYERARGSLAGLVFWDLLACLAPIKWLAHWVEGYQELGVDLPLPDARARLESWVARMLWHATR